MPWCRDERDDVVKCICALNDIDTIGSHHGKHRIGNPWARRGIVPVPRSPIGQFAVGEDVARFWKGRYPLAIFQPRVPTHVVGMQVRTHDEIDVVYAKARRGEILLIAIRVHHVPKGTRGSWLMVADARIDQDIVMARLHEVALDAKDEFVGGIEKPRLEPGAIFLEQLLGQGREKVSCCEERSLLLNDAVDCDRPDLDLNGHGGFAVGCGCRWEDRPALIG
jgi:hypothetical protein